MSAVDQQQSAILKALADENRLRLIRLLWHEPLNVQELCEVLEMPQPKVSRHLSVLRAAELVQVHREGSRVYYSVGELKGSHALAGDYLRGIADQDHPDFERLEACLRARDRASADFASKAADEWDRIGMELHSSTAALFAMADLAPRGLTVADLGTGTGLMLPLLSHLGSQVIAVDQAPEMLAYARRRCTDYGITGVDFIAGDLMNLQELISPRLDCALLHFVLHQVGRPAAVVKSAASCLEPGGRLVIVDRFKHEDETAHQRFGSIWLGFAEEDVRGWLDEAELKDVQYTLLHHAANTELTLFVAAASR